MKWEKIEFGELYLIPSKNGLNRPSRVRGSGYKMINMGELFANDRIKDIPMELVPLNDREIESSNILEQDLLFARQSIVASGAGKCSIVLEVPEITTFESHLIRVRLNSDRANPLFYYYYFKTPFANMKSLVQQGVQAGIRGSELKNLNVFYPPLSTQRRIASILSAYDDLIENNLKRIKLLEEKAQMHYKIDFGEYQFGDKEPQNLPKGWSVKSIGDIYGKLESGSRPKGGIDKELKEGIASVGAENVIGLGKYNYQSEKLINEAFFENMNRGKIENKDILIYKDGAYIGKTTLFQDDFPHDKCCVNEHVFLLRSIDELYQNYLFFTLYQKLYFNKMQQLNANAAQPGINQESLKSLRILWPSKSVIEEFNDKVESLMKLIFVLAKQNTKLREARDILLPKLMNGQIEV
ncbi:MAG: restriction endonuclease subunit S [Saprospiraceae bacterium]